MSKRSKPLLDSLIQALEGLEESRDPGERARRGKALVALRRCAKQDGIAEVLKAPDSKPRPSVLMDMAQSLVERAAAGNELAAELVLKEAAVALRDKASGRPPDPERAIYLRYLSAAMEQIRAGVETKKALGLWTSGRPRVPNRDLNLFYLVGVAYSGGMSVHDAKKQVAKTRGIGTPTVSKAWERGGGLQAWKLVQRLLAE